MLLILVLCLQSEAAAQIGDKEFIKLCKLGSVAQVQATIQAGANIHARDISGFTPLHMAARGHRVPESHQRNIEVVKLLLKAGANVNARNTSGLTPLHEAAMWTSAPEVIKILLDAGADPKAKDAKDSFPFIGPMGTERASSQINFYMVQKNTGC